jgi:hypothetical protein
MPSKLMGYTPAQSYIEVGSSQPNEFTEARRRRYGVIHGMPSYKTEERADNVYRLLAVCPKDDADL